MSSSKLVLKSTTSTSLNDRFSKLMKNRPEDSGKSLVDKSGSVRPGSEKNRKFAEELERRSGVGQQIRRKPLSKRLGDVGQGGARGFKQAIKRTPTKGGLAGRVGKRTENSNMANRALKRAQDMLRDTERELNILKRNKSTSGRVGVKPAAQRLGNSNRGRGGPNRGNRGGGRGATRGNRGGNRGGTANRGGRPGADVSQDTLDKQLDSYMLKSKGGQTTALDQQMDDYMSKTKGGLDKQMEDYMAQKSK